MNYLDVIVLAVVEGITEFLPISSTGHLNLTSTILHIQKDDFFKSFEIYIQLGAIFAVCALYWKLIVEKPKILKQIITAFLPTAIIGFILYKFIKQYLLANDLITVIALLMGGIILIILELLYKEKEHDINLVEEISYTKALLIGIAQSIAIIPGVSRSAATIVAGLFLGVKRKTAAEFSFLLAAPTMFAATILDLKESSFSFSNQEWLLLGLGMITSFITAYIAIKWLLHYVQKNTFIAFGFYRIVIAIVFYFLFML